MIWNTAETTSAVEALAENLQELQKPGKIKEIIDGWLPHISNFVVVLLLALVIWFVGKRLIKLVIRIADRSFEKVGMDVSVKKFLNSMMRAVLYAILVFTIAELIGFPESSIIALLGSGGLAIGLAMQGSLSNFAGGVLLLMLRPFQIGDYIVTGSGEGTVHAIGIFYTTLATADNKTVVIPNGTLSNGTITNVTSQEKRRIDISVGVSYQADIRKAKEIMAGIMNRNEKVLKDHDMLVFVDNLADSSVTMGMRCWTETADYWTTKWELTERIKLEFDAAGIEIPYNQLDVHMR